jgi:hypothetical protein
MRLLHQCTIKKEDIVKIQNLLADFLLEFEELYVKRRTDRLHMVRPWLHTLAHGAKEVTRVGPPGLSSTWTIEQTIGNLGEEIRQPSNPYANLAERGLKRCQLNALKALYPGLGASIQAIPQGAKVVGGGYVLLRARDPRPQLQHGRIAQVITDFLSQQQQHDIPAESSVYVSRWARLSLPNGQVVRSAWKEELKALKDIRMARFVKVYAETSFKYLTAHTLR